MHDVRREDISEALRHVGVVAGGCVFLYCDLRIIGRLHDARTSDEYCRAYLDAIFDVIGASGTLVVPTGTTQVARFDIPFVWEETPTILGVFPEYIRRLSGSMRSIHPINSFSAVGNLKDYICGNNGFTDFGLGSPPDRLYNSDAAILTIGLESGYVCGVAHHLEVMCGLPYVYNKVLKWQPVVSGKPWPGRFISSVRYLSLDFQYNFRRYVKHMRELGAVRSRRLGRGWVHAASYRAVFDEGARMLCQDPFWLLESEPNFVYGEIPFDGPTGGRDGVVSAIGANVERVQNWSGFNFSRISVGTDESELDDDGEPRRR